MKKFFVILLAAYSFTAINAQRPINKPRSSSHARVSTSTTPSSRMKISSEGVIAWQYVEVGYENIHLATTSAFSRNFNVGECGYHIGFNVMSDIKIETGLNFAYGTSKNVQYNIVNKPLHVDYTYGFAKLPILAAYRFDVNETVSLIPNAGLYVKYNIAATSEDYSDDKDVQAAYKYYGLKFGKQDLFGYSEKSSSLNWERFGYGIQVGVNAIVSEHFLLGASYSYEFNEIAANGNYRATCDLNVKVGYVF